MKINLSNMQNRKYYLIYVLFIGIMFVSSVVLTVVAATKGAEINHLEKQKTALKMEQEELSAQLVSQVSLAKISEKSSSLGLVKPQNILYLNNQEASVATLR